MNSEQIQYFRGEISQISRSIVFLTYLIDNHTLTEKTFTIIENQIMGLKEIKNFLLKTIDVSVSEAYPYE